VSDGNFDSVSFDGSTGGFDVDPVVVASIVQAGFVGDGGKRRRKKLANEKAPPALRRDFGRVDVAPTPADSPAGQVQALAVADAPVLTEQAVIARAGILDANSAAAFGEQIAREDSIRQQQEEFRKQFNKRALAIILVAASIH
jgi:hypothetical protein